MRGRGNIAEPGLGLEVETDELPEVNTSTTKSKAKEEKKNFRITWSDEMEHCLILTCVEQVRLRKRTNSGYKPKLWETAKDAI